MSKQRKKGTFGIKYQVISSPKLKTPKSKVVSFLAKKERRGQRKRPFGINSLLAVKHNIMLSQSRQMWTYSTTTLKAVESIFFSSSHWSGLVWTGLGAHYTMVIFLRFSLIFEKSKVHSSQSIKYRPIFLKTTCLAIRTYVIKTRAKSRALEFIFF